MGYADEILRVMTAAGDEGLTVKQASRLVFNATNSFFEPLDFDDVRRSVSRHLVSHSKRSDSLYAKVARGVYRLNPMAKELRQRQFAFGDDDETTNDTPMAEELPLKLF